MKSRVKSIFIFTSVIIFLLTGAFVVSYKWIVPAFVNSYCAELLAENLAKQILNADVNIDGMKLRTGLDISFNVKGVAVDKDGNKINLSGL